MRETSVFMSIEGSLNDVASSIAPLIGAEWTEVDQGGYAPRMEWFNGSEDVILVNEVHEEDDDDIAFSRYPFSVSVDRSNSKERIRVAHDLFEKLKGLNVPLMLVDDMEIKLDEWKPTV